VAARAHIIIRQKESDPDEVLVYVADYGFYYGSRGVIRTLIKAYYNEAALSSISHNLRRVGNLKDILNSFVRENIGSAASSIIHAGVGTYVPVSKRGYEEYAKKGVFYRDGFRYIITISDEYDQDGDAIWEITVKTSDYGDITRTLKEWQKFSELDVALERMLSDKVDCRSNIDETNLDKSMKDSIHFEEIDFTLLKDIYSNIGASPCDICGARPACISVDRPPGNSRIRKIRNACEDRENYSKTVQEFLVGKLSYDKQFQDLLMYASSESYLTLKYTR
jgi:hypothetical protein